jgi:endonuclease/exonuclease/phosphatase family metal-dependent hydrolase
VAIQEAFASVDGRFDTAARLACHLGMAFTYLPERRKPRVVDGQLLDSHSGLAVLTRQPVDEHVFLPLPSTVDDGGRSALLLRWREDGRNIVLGNVHLSHLADGGTLRRQQLECLLRHPWFTEKEADLTLVCGDFNAELTAPELREFLAPPWSWRNACAGLTGKLTYTMEENDGRDLDHILIGPSSRMAVSDARVVLNLPDSDIGAMASDHRGVAATFR